MIDAKLLALLRCPIDGSQLEMAPLELIEQLNAAIARGEIRDRADEKVVAPLDAALTTRARQHVYPIRNHIPTLVADEAITLTGLPLAQ